ncbi:MAG: creatinine amidohydrolase [Candidatus Atribacteria bacterium]|nr:creatinine amidohydrolase [Candidatus Atribacteria bacterium]
MWGGVKRLILTEQAWQEISQKRKEGMVALLPVGSVEQHGYHAPLGTDLFIAESLVEKVSREKDVIALSPIPVGVSEYHRHFGGTLWVKPETLKQYVKEICESLSYHGIKKIIIVNGHGGNRGPLGEVARYLRMEGIAYVVVWTWFESAQEEIVKIFGNLPPLHADEVETSLLMIIKKNLVRCEFLKKSAEGSSATWGAFHKGTMISQEVIDFSKSGATGNPERADSEKGERLLEELCSNLISLIQWFRGVNSLDLSFSERE